MKLIEQRPRSVYNAKPVKQSISQELPEIRKRLNGYREMVKLLRLCIDFGKEHVLQAAQTLTGKELRLAQIQGLLIEQQTKPINTTIKGEISVSKSNLTTYDQLLKGSSK